MEMRGSRLRLGLPGPAGEQGGWRCTQFPILRGASLLLRGPTPAPRGPRVAGRCRREWAAGGRRRRCGCAPARWGRPQIEITFSPNAVEPAGLLGWFLLLLVF